MGDEHRLVGYGCCGRLLHVVNEGLERLLAAAHLLEGNEVPLVIYVHDRLDVQKRARPGARARDAAAAEQEHEVVHGEPVGQVQLVLLHPVAHLFDGRPLLAHLRRVVDEQALAAGSGQGVHRVHSTVGVEPRQLGQQKLDGLVGTGKAAGKSQVKHIAALPQQRLDALAGLLQVRKRGGDDLPLAHHGVELGQIGLLALQVAAVLLAVHHEGERQDGQVKPVDHLLGEVARRIGDDGKAHGRSYRVLGPASPRRARISLALF